MIIICVALEKEIPPLFKQQYPHHWVRINALQAGKLQPYIHQYFLVVVTGVSRQSSCTINWLIQHFKVSEIVNIGTAGSTHLTCNQWVRLHQCEYNGQIVTCKDQTALPIPYHQFAIHSGLTVDTHHSSHMGDVIDMEAYFLAQTCHQYGVSFVSFKWITDANPAHLDSFFSTLLPMFHTEFSRLLSYLCLPKLDISVIIPTFNRHQWLDRAIESVINQTHQADEIIVVDDGSTPPIKNRHPSVSMVRLNQNLGISVARNMGILTSKSNWICLLDSDDTWTPQHLSVMVDYLKGNPLCRFLQTEESWIRNGQPLNKKKYHQKPSGFALKESMARCLVSPSAVMFHRSLLNWHGLFDTRLTVCEDYDLWLRLLRFHPVDLVEKPTLIKYGGHSDQLSTQYSAMDRFRVLSLLQAYNHEHNPVFRSQYADVLLKKLKILYDGAKKRNHDTQYYYKNCIELIQSGHQSCNVQYSILNQVS